MKAHKSTPPASYFVFLGKMHRLGKNLEREKTLSLKKMESGRVFVKAFNESLAP